jgi:ABC-type sugar transport system ATPase subunit
MNIFEFKNFSIYYKLKSDYVVAVDSVSFTVDSGDFFVIVGESGSGKSSILRSMFGGAGGATRGQLLVNNRSIDDIKVAEQNFAYVSQNYSLNPGMTVYENLAFPLQNMKTPPEEVNIRVRSIAKAFGIYPLLTRKPRYISGGQHQRAAIARALIKNPRVILMDEPFSSLDATLRLEFRSLLKKYHDLNHCSIVFVTHDLVEAFFLADKILVMQDGKVAEMGTPAELEEKHRSPLLKEFFGR